MHPSLYTAKKKFASWYLQLSPREKLIIGITTTAVVFFAIYGSLSLAFNLSDSLETKIVRGKIQAEELVAKLNRYNEVNETYKRLQEQFEQSQTTFEDVAVTLDSIREKSNIKKENFDFATESIVDIGLEYKKQEYTLTVKNLSLKELVDLLYTIEQKAKSLFMGDVDIVKARAEDSFRVTINLSNIRKTAS
jgi:hypothetical protein